MSPAVSIIMPTFNRAYIIRDAIDSVLAQTDPNWELIIMDDGSTDDTAAVVRSYAEPRIQYYQQANGGSSSARNAAMEHASGTWIAYLDSDNELLPKFVEVMLEHFRRHPKASFGIPKGYYAFELYQDGRQVASVDKSAMFPESLSLQDIFYRTIPFEMNGFMHKRSLFTDGTRFDEEIPGMEDWDLALQIGEKHPDGFLYVPVTLYNYHQRYGTDGRAASGSYSTRVHKLECIWRKHRYDKLMQGQPWYPALADEWKDREQRYQAGLLPPMYLYEFKDHWPKRLQRV